MSTAVGLESCRQDGAADLPDAPGCPGAGAGAGAAGVAAAVNAAMTAAVDFAVDFVVGVAAVPGIRC
ncbi:MAG: hypothetical protein ACKO7Z_04505 [Cyanobacteriota bacterium]